MAGQKNYYSIQNSGGELIGQRSDIAGYISRKTLKTLPLRYLKESGIGDRPGRGWGASCTADTGKRGWARNDDFRLFCFPALRIFFCCTMSRGTHTSRFEHSSPLGLEGTRLVSLLSTVRSTYPLGIKDVNRDVNNKRLAMLDDYYSRGSQS